MKPPEHSLAAMSTHDHGGMSTDKHLGKLMSTNEHSKNKSPKGFENSWLRGSITIRTHESSWAHIRTTELSEVLIINPVSEYLIKKQQKVLALIMPHLCSINTISKSRSHQIIRMRWFSNLHRKGCRKISKMQFLPPLGSWKIPKKIPEQSQWK